MRHVIAMHYGGYEPKYPGITFWQSLTTICNQIFIASSSYFLCNSSFKFSRLLVILIQTVMVCYLVFLYQCYKGNTKFTWENNKINLFPVANQQYWFPSAFILGQMLFAGLMILFKKLNIIGHLIVFFTLYYFGLCSIAGFGHSVVAFGSGLNVYYMILCLLHGAIIRLNNIRLKSIYCIFGFLIFSVLHYYGMMHKFRLYIHYKWLSNLLESDLMYAPLPVISATFLLLLAQNMKIPKSIGYVVNFVSNQNYYIYLWHIHPIHFIHMFTQFKDRHRKDLAFKGTLHHTIVVYFESLFIAIIITFISNFLIFNAPWFNYLMTKLDEITAKREDRAEEQQQNYQNIHATNTDETIQPETNLENLAEKDDEIPSSDKEDEIPLADKEEQKEENIEI